MYVRVCVGPLAHLGEVPGALVLIGILRVVVVQRQVTDSSPIGVAGVPTVVPFRRIHRVEVRSRSQVAAGVRECDVTRRLAAVR